MLIIHDSRLPEEEIFNLQKHGECLPFYTENITHKAISGHPDIFFCQIDRKIIVAPNTPSVFVDFLVKKDISLQIGKNFVGDKKQNAVSYNAVVTDKYVIHNRKFTDEVILEETKHKTFIDVNQGFTRCSLMPLKDDNFITSDKGIEKKLLQNGLKCHYFSPDEIILSDFPYGFIGGCMGEYQGKIFITGSLKHHSQGDKIECLFKRLDYQIVELYNGKLFDVGGLVFFEF